MNLINYYLKKYLKKSYMGIQFYFTKPYLGTNIYRIWHRRLFYKNTLVEYSINSKYMCGKGKISPKKI